MSGALLPGVRLVSVEVTRAGEPGKLEVEVELAWRDTPDGSLVTRTIGPFKLRSQVGARRDFRDEVVIPPVTSGWVLWALAVRDRDRPAERAGDVLPDAFERPEVRGALAAIAGATVAGALPLAVGALVGSVRAPDILALGGGYLTPGAVVPGPIVVEPDPERRRGGAVRVTLELFR